MPLDPTLTIADKTVEELVALYYELKGQGLKADYRLIEDHLKKSGQEGLLRTDIADAPPVAEAAPADVVTETPAPEAPVAE